MTTKKTTKKTAARRVIGVKVYFSNLEVLDLVRSAHAASGLPTLSSWIAQAAVEKARRELGLPVG